MATGPENFDAVSNFDLSAYLGSWFVQEQQVTRYLPLKRNYCVSAKYSLNDRGIKVDNSARDNGCTGEARGAVLQAIIPDANRPSKLLVGPTWLPDMLKGPYWVVATSDINPDSKMYEWAIITGGKPSFKNEATGLWSCKRTSIFNFNGNGEGFWLFTRDPHVPVSVVENMRAKATALGLDVSVLNKVEQLPLPSS